MLALVTTDKTPWNELTSEQQKEFDVFIVNKILAMDPEYVEFVNVIQMHYNLPKEHSYNILYRILPRRRVVIDFIKKKSKVNKDLLKIVSKHLETSMSEAESYIMKLSKEDTVSLLNNLGYDEKEIKKLLK